MRTIFYFTGTRNKINFIHHQRSFHGKNLIRNSRKKRSMKKERYKRIGISSVEHFIFLRRRFNFFLVFSIRYTK
uniref:Uncharacterized protein n=1 Tax=viral metagenome TaxID=1070528 RepID=A0A6C0D1C5_9ZZZZ